MKKLFVMLLAVTLFKLLILPHYTSTSLAAPVTVAAGVTTDLISNDKPVVGFVGFEAGPARMTAGAGYNGRGEGAFDLIARSPHTPLYVGFGLFSERAETYEEFTTTDTTVTTTPGKGKKHKKGRKGGKVITNNMYQFRGEDYAMYPSILMGVAGRRTFFESRVIFGTTDTISGQASFGFRW